jgi:hypothetical protein
MIKVVERYGSLGDTTAHQYDDEHEKVGVDFFHQVPGINYLANQMKNFNTQYLFSGFFLLFGAYQMYEGAWLEASLYTLAALAFIFNSLASHKKFERHKKVLVIITWTLMIATALLFVWFLQFKKYI